MPGSGTDAKNEPERKWYHYLTALLFILAGAVLIVYKDIDISAICKVFAAVFAAAGIISIISYCIKDVAVGYYRLDLVYGAVALFAALLFITDQDAVSVYFPVIAGLTLLANGVVKLQHSIDMKRIDRKMKKVTEMWLVVMIFALIGIAAGFVTVYLTPSETGTLFLVVGIALVVAGVSDVFTHIVFSNKLKAFENRVSADDKVLSGAEQSEEKAGDGEEKTDAVDPET